MIIFIILGFIPFNIWASEPPVPKHRMSWYHYQLKDLMDATKSKTESEASEKRAYVEFCKDLYEKAKKRLDEITVETQGHISETQDPSKANYKTVYVNHNVMEYCPADIKMLKFLIGYARQTYLTNIKGRN